MLPSFFVLHVRYEDVFCVWYRSRVFGLMEGAHDVCDVVSSLLVFDRSYFACDFYLLVCLRSVLCCVSV